MMVNVVLTQPLSVRDQTVTLSSGPIALNAALIIPADVPHDRQERMEVSGVLSKTQAKVIRGMHGTSAGAYPSGTVVALSVDGILHEPVEQPEELAPPDTIRVPRRKLPEVGGAIKQACCPTCGRALD